ncbi:MAG TPA: HmuY family protein [Kofleriaceae bacterium]
MRHLVLICIVGCADKIEHHVSPDASQVQPDASGSGLASVPVRATTTPNADGSFTTIVDSTSETEWTNFDFETKANLDASGAWDLRAQRFHISTNNAGNAKVAPLAQTFAATTTAPTDPAAYLQDTDAATYAFDEGDSWYDYNVDTHVLTPKPLTYVVQTDGGSTVKLEIIKYYDAAGTSGFFTWHWAPL